MAKKIIPAIMFVFLGFILNCGEGLETGGFSPVSLLTISDFGPHYTEPMPPEVTAVTPADTSSGISTLTTISARFSEAMNPPTINTATFTVATSMGPVIGDVTYSVSTRTATFTPDAPLAAVELHNVTITTGATDLSGTPMDADYSWSFETAMGGTVGAPWFDPIPPYTSEGPMSVTLNADDPSATIIYTINDPVDPDPDSLPMYGTTCAPGTSIALTETSTIKAIAFRTGYHNSAMATGIYTLQAPPPTIDPASGTYGPGNTVVIDAPGYLVTVTVTTSMGSGTAYNRTPPYTVSLDRDMTVSAYASITGMEDSVTVSETYAYDTVAPEVLSTSPVDDGTERHVPYTSLISVTFTKEMNASTITTNGGAAGCTGSIRVVDDGGACVPLIFDTVPSADGYTWSMYVPSPGLGTGTHYSILVTAGVLDVYGNAMAADYQSPSGFTTDVVGLVDTDTFNATQGYYYIDDTMVTRGNALALRSDGYIYVAGVNGNVLVTDFGVWRFLPDGTPDSTTFVSPGFTGTGSSEAHDIALQSGRSVVAGFCPSTNNDFGLAGYLDSGTLDSSFGRSLTPGRYELDWGFASAEKAYGMALDAAENIVVVGYTTETISGTQDFAIARFFPDAKSLDFSFASNGQDNLEMGAGGLNESATAVAIDPGIDELSTTDDLIAVVGWHDTSNSLDKVVAVVLYENAGTAVRSFTDPISTISEANAVAIQSDHRIVVAGRVFNGTHNDILVIRYNNTGSRDTTFGTGGVQTIDLYGGLDEYATAVAIQDDGKILLAGTATRSGYANDIVVVRLNQDGTLDKSFGNLDGDGVDGAVAFDIGSNNQYAEDIVIQPDNRIVVTGTHNGGTNDDMVLLRFR